MKKIIKWFAVVFIVLAAMLSAIVFAALNVVEWLGGSDLPEQARAIMVLSGPPSRALYAADLYNRGYAKEVYVTRPVRENYLKLTDDLGVYFPRTEQVQKDVLVRKGVPGTNIHIVGNDCRSTVDEAKIANSIFRGDGCRILIVSSPYHVKRAQMIFRDNVKECRFKVLATPYEPFPKKWWTDQDSARNILLEVTKIVFYKLGGRFESKEEKVMGNR